MAITELKITNRFWAEMSRTSPDILSGHINHDFDPTKMRAVMLAAAGRVINQNRIPMSIDDDIIFCPDGNVIITERPQE